jgi:PIN domain nuclease of toxin-antitoxin system
VKVLLDTCTFLWLVEGDSALSGQARQAIVDPENEVFLSSASAWEIVIKHGLGRLELVDSPEVYVPRQRTLHRIDTLPIQESAILQIGKLPALHRDPFDRILVAQSIVHGCILATPDPLIRRYPVQFLW